MGTYEVLALIGVIFCFALCLMKTPIEYVWYDEDELEDDDD